MPSERTWSERDDVPLETYPTNISYRIRKTHFFTFTAFFSNRIGRCCFSRYYFSELSPTGLQSRPQETLTTTIVTFFVFTLTFKFHNLACLVSTAAFCYQTQHSSIIAGGRLRHGNNSLSRIMNTNHGQSIIITSITSFPFFAARSTTLAAGDEWTWILKVAAEVVKQATIGGQAFSNTASRPPPLFILPTTRLLWSAYLAIASSRRLRFTPSLTWSWSSLPLCFISNRAASAWLLLDSDFNNHFSDSCILVANEPS